MTEVGRRERKRLQTHEALIDAAARLFREKGFDSTTVEDITEAADVSARTFFRHFSSKEDVVFAGMSDRVGELGEALAARPADEAVLTSVRQALLSLVHVFEDERDRLLLQAELVDQSPSVAARSVHLRNELSDLIAGGVAERLGVDPDVDLRPKLVGGAIVGALGAAVDTWVSGGARDALGARVERALALLERNFGLDD